MNYPNPRRIVLAPDKFKGSLTAPQVAAALASGMTRVSPDLDIRQAPIADGGDGTLDAFLAAGWERIDLDAAGATGVPGPTAYAAQDKTAVIELAAVVGLAKLPGGQRDPLHASTYGLGEVIAHALDRGAREIVLGVGGSASTDGGAGMLQALGLRILDAEDNELPRGGATLARAAAIDRSTLHPALSETTFTLATDVDNPLLGPHGAVAIFAPQKGAAPGECAILEASLTNWSRLIDPSAAARPGAGAAGGTGFGAMTVLGAIERPGIEVILDLIDFRSQLPGADLVVTGEGSLDEQTLHGKGPIGVSDAARAAGVPVVAVAGRCLLSPGRLRAAGLEQCYSLADLEPDLTRSIAHAAALLDRIGERIAKDRLPVD